MGQVRHAAKRGVEIIEPVDSTGCRGERGAGIWEITTTWTQIILKLAFQLNSF